MSLGEVLVRVAALYVLAGYYTVYRYYVSVDRSRMALFHVKRDWGHYSVTIQALMVMFYGILAWPS